MAQVKSEETQNKGMYLKDKAQRITLRLNEEQFQFIKASADDFGISPSDMLRQIINLAMRAAKGDASVTKFRHG